MSTSTLVPTEARTLSQGDLAALGMEEIAYVKTVTVNGQTAYAVFAANGKPLAAVVDRDTANAMVRQNDMEPLSVH